MTLLSAVLVWAVVSVLSTAFLARVLAGAHRVEQQALSAPHMPADAPSLVALGIALPSPRAALDERATARA